jgi:hypothetical protein
MIINQSFKISTTIKRPKSHKHQVTEKENTSCPSGYPSRWERGRPLGVLVILDPVAFAFVSYLPLGKVLFLRLFCFEGQTN